MDDTIRTEPDDAPCGAPDDELTQYLVGMIREALRAAAAQDQDFVTRFLCIHLESEPENAFCLYGYLSVLACMLRMCGYMRQRDPDIPWEDPNHWGDNVPTVCSQAFQGVHNAVTGYANMIEFLPDSGWPWTVRSLWHTMAEWRGSRWSSDGEIRRAVQAELAQQAAYRRDIVFHPGGALPRSEVKVFALGMHTGLLRAPLSALRLVLEDGPRLEVEAPAGGGGAVCEVAPASHDCGARDLAFAGILARHLSKWIPDPEVDRFNREAIDSIQEMKAAMQRAFGGAMRAADLLLCTEPMAFCTFFEGLGVPVVAYLGNNPLFYLTPPDFDAALDSMARMASHPRNCLLAISPVLAVLLEQYLEGARPVVDTPLGLHVGTALHGYWAPTQDSQEEAKVLLTKRVTDTFDQECMLRMIFETSHTEGSPLTVRLVSMGDKTVPAEQLSFEAFAHFRAALVLPMDALQMAVYDLYAVALPLFVPDPLERLPPFVHRKLRAIAITEPAPTKRPAGSFPYWRPFTRADDLEDLGPGQGWDAMRAWTLLTDFAQLPHLRHYLSVAQLLEYLADAHGLAKTSRAMSLEHGRLMLRSANLWRGLLGRAFHSP